MTHIQSTIIFFYQNLPESWRHVGFLCLFCNAWSTVEASLALSLSLPPYLSLSLSEH